jgi:choline-sulfatase
MWIGAAAFAAPAIAAALLAGPRLTGWMRAAHAGPNILLITLDTTRADHLPAYGYRLGRTPHLDRLATEGVVFERAVAAAPITLPSHVSLFTGLYPFVHGVRNNGSAALTDKLPTLATALHDRGYRTAAFVSAFVLDRRFGLARGFDHYDDQLETRNQAANVEVERRGDRTGLAAEEWLTKYASSAASSGPFFIWLHLYDAHDPYDPPAPFHDAFADRLYDGEIAFDDAVLGSMLDRIDRLGMLSSTLIAVVGDHGESLGDHGEVTHSMFVYEAALRVPMIVWWPGHLPAAKRLGPLVRSIDLTPTLLDLAGAPALAGAAGQSLTPLVRGQAPGPGVAYGETYFPLFYMNWAPLRSIQDDRWKFIDAPAEELYDLSIDPQELTNVAAREPGRTGALRRALDALTSGHQGPVSATAMDRETAEKLAALGYIAAGSAAPTTPGQAPAASRDPKLMIGVFNRLRRANAAVHEGRLTEAEAIARDILDRDRQNAFATLILASALMEQGRYRDALARYREYSALVPTSADAHHWMAICHLRLGDRDRALAEEEAALAVDPHDADARALRGGLLAERGRLDEAIQELRAAVAAEPNKAAFHVGLARILNDARRFDEADAEYRRALELEPGDPGAHSGYAVLLSARDQPDRAVAEFERSLELQPGDDQTRLRLADVLAKIGRRQEARTEYARLVSGRGTPLDIRTTARDRLARLRGHF